MITEYRIIKNINLFSTLPEFGFFYRGNYYRGHNWVRVMDGIDVATGDDPKNGIMIHGDWDNRRICFKHPYRNGLLNRSVAPCIQDLIQAGIVEVVNKGEIEHEFS